MIEDLINKELNNVINIKTRNSFDCFGTRIQGNDVAQQIKEIFKKEDQVVLNFKGIRTFSHLSVELAFEPFFNKYGNDVFENKIVIKAETPEREKQLKRAFNEIVKNIDKKAIR